MTNPGRPLDAVLAPQPIDRARAAQAAELGARLPDWIIQYDQFGWLAMRGKRSVRASSPTGLQAMVATEPAVPDAADGPTALLGTVFVWCSHVGNAEARYLASRVRGPFAPDALGHRAPGAVTDLGAGWIALDGAAMDTLSQLPYDMDGRVTWEGREPVLHVGKDRHAVLPSPLQDAHDPGL
jgi:hypothetical protein